MIATYGFDLQKKNYWYCIRYMGEEVKAERNLTKAELEEAKAENSMCRWIADYEFII